jgi:hypothetical protein
LIRGSRYSSYITDTAAKEVPNPQKPTTSHPPRFHPHKNAALTLTLDRSAIYT